MKRITQQDLQDLVDRINEIQGQELKTYSEQENGTFKANIGNYHISGAYGGVALHQMFNLSGGIRDISGCGYVPKKELYNWLRAYLAGLTA